RSPWWPGSACRCRARLRPRSRCIWKVGIAWNSKGLGGSKLGPRSQVDFFSAVLGAFVDRADDGDRFAGFAGGNGGLAAFADGVDDFLEVALVLEEIDRGRIVRADSDLLAFHEGAADFGVFRFFGSEVPQLESFVG